jgi:hypothetical protein
MNGNACTCVDVILREKIREKESKPTELDLKISEEVKGPNVTTCTGQRLAPSWLSIASVLGRRILILKDSESVRVRCCKCSSSGFPPELDSVKSSVFYSIPSWRILIHVSTVHRFPLSTCLHQPVTHVDKTEFVSSSGAATSPRIICATSCERP